MMDLGRCGIVGALALVAGAAGCGATSQTAFGAGGFSSGYGYDVRYVDGRHLMSTARWALDNYQLDNGSWVEKGEPGYLTSYKFDDDGDGTIDTRFDRSTYALRFESKQNAGLIWLRNIPLPMRVRAKELRVMLRRYVDQIAGAKTGRIDLADDSSPASVEIREAATIVEQGAVTVAGHPGYAATVSFANIGGLRSAPGERARRARIVLVYAPGTEVSDDGQDKARDRTFKNTASAPIKQYAVLAVAGYSNLPHDFDSGLADFNEFVSRFTIDGASGLTSVEPTAEP